MVEPAEFRADRSRHAPAALGTISFVESSVFPIPADVLFIPMCAARPDKAMRYAFLASLTSVLGGIFGWMIGYFAFATIAAPVLEFYGKLDEFEALRTSGGTGLILLMLVTSGLAHLPPIKVVTILSGVIGFSLPLFILSAIIARGARFFALAWLLRTYGEPIRHFVEERLGLIAAAAAGVLILLYILVRYVF